MMKLHLRFEVPTAYREDPGADCEGSVEINSRIRDYMITVRNLKISGNRFVVGVCACLSASSWVACGVLRGKNVKNERISSTKPGNSERGTRQETRDNRESLAVFAGSPQ